MWKCHMSSTVNCKLIIIDHSLHFLFTSTKADLKPTSTIVTNNVDLHHCTTALEKWKEWTSLFSHTQWVYSCIKCITISAASKPISLTPYLSISAVKKCSRWPLHTADNLQQRLQDNDICLTRTMLL